MGAKHLAAGGQRGFGSGAPNAAAIFPVFSKIKHFQAYFGLNYPVSMSFSGQATSLFIYFTSVLASVPAAIEV